MSNELGQKPAFPSSHVAGKSIYTDGVSKRFYAACMIMSGLVANATFFENATSRYDAVKEVYLMVDELLKQETL
jgi:hypothetical protein